ncbi:hypothetical protein [Brucella sp. JSBI001]|uniref:hypothetical protein n=1 Tax=Brucella sp. JSBI001 TaxID=2886044 RepID=UPI00222FD1D4|nr:hypothetical protein [Brucella sp. JSBI001]UZD70426.1 hypothetical protein LJ361_02990 [Brucella sp. JSBI001]
MATRSFKCLLPDEDGILEILDKFQRIPELAMIGAPGSYVSNAEYWGSNKDTVNSLLRANNIECEDSDLGFLPERCIGYVHNVQLGLLLTLIYQPLRRKLVKEMVRWGMLWRDQFQ